MEEDSKFLVGETKHSKTVFIYPRNKKLNSLMGYENYCYLLSYNRGCLFVLNRSLMVRVNKHFLTLPTCSITVAST